MPDRIADIWGDRTPHPRGTAWPARVDLYLADGLAEADVDRWVQSACVLCSNGCGCDIAVKDGKMVGVRGRATDVVNHGRLGPKGLYGSTAFASSPDRLTRPLVREGGRLAETDWGPPWAASSRGAAREQGAVEPRLLHDRPDLHRGVLHARADRQGGARHAAHGRQHPHLHGHRSGGDEGELRLRRSAGQLHRHRATDAIFLFGHNMPETQTVLWMRILDRTRGEDPPAIVCVDVRRTTVAQEAERTGGVHLAPGWGPTWPS